MPAPIAHAAAAKGPRWVRVVVAIGVLLAAFVVMLFLAVDSPEMSAFKARRTAWHQKCDAYIDVPDNRLDAKGRECLQEFQALQADAKRLGR